MLLKQQQTKREGKRWALSSELVAILTKDLVEGVLVLADPGFNLLVFVSELEEELDTLDGGLPAVHTGLDDPQQETQRIVNPPVLVRVFNLQQERQHREEWFELLVVHRP